MNAEQRAEHLNSILQTLPESPGVYKYFDKTREMIYIGKAKNLKKRVTSYFTKNHYENHKTYVMVSKVDHIEFTLVETEIDALLLENSLIKKFQPKYNINLKDDKSYPFIRLVKEPFPRVYPTRQPVRDGSEYFGPYASVSMMHTMLDLVRQINQIRTCNLDLKQKNIEAKKFKVCLEYHIGNCKGPCEGLQTEEDYNQSISNARDILKGNTGKVISFLKEKISNASLSMKFEEAALLKKKLDLLEKLPEQINHCKQEH